MIHSYRQTTSMLGRAYFEFHSSSQTYRSDIELIHHNWYQHVIKVLSLFLLSNVSSYFDTGIPSTMMFPSCGPDPPTKTMSGPEQQKLAKHMACFFSLLILAVSNRQAVTQRKTESNSHLDRKLNSKWGRGGWVWPNPAFFDQSDKCQGLDKTAHEVVIKFRIVINNCSESQSI